MSAASIPSVARWILSRCLPLEDRRFALADLEEEFERRCGDSGGRSARSWYRGQAARSVVPALLDRWDRRPRSLGADLLQDVRFAARTLLQTPVMAVVTILSLAIGIAVTTAVFTVANALLFTSASASITEPEQLVAVFTSTNDGSQYGQNSYLDYVSVGEQVEAFEDVAAHRVGLVRIERQDGARRIIAEIVSGNYFSVLGIRLPVGRGFLPEESRLGAAERLAVISQRLWEEELGHDPAVIGKTLVVDGNLFTVIGVAPEDLSSRILALRADMWVPIGIPGGVFRSNEKELSARGDRNYGIIARLRPGASVQTAQVQADLAAARLHRAYQLPWQDDREQPRRMTVLEEKAARVPPDFFAALAAGSSIVLLAAALILAIACSNVAGVMLARADHRRREMGVRLALGAGRLRIVRMLLTESLLLALAAGALGIWLSILITTNFNSIALPIGDLFLEFDLRSDARVPMFGLGLALLTTLAFGLAPALEATRNTFLPALRGEAPEGPRRRRRFVPRNLVVVMQVAVALIFVVGSAVAMRSFEELTSMDWGVNPERMAIMSKTIPEEVGEDALVPYYRELMQRLEAHPAIEVVTLGRTAEGSSVAIDSQAQISVDGYESAPGEGLRFPFNAVAPGYIEAVGIRMIAGRTFTERDDATGALVAVVDEAFARRFWPASDPIGQQFRILGRRESAGPEEGTASAAVYEVVGVAATARYQGFESSGQIYFWTSLYQEPSGLVTILARGRNGADEALGVLQGEVDPADTEFTLISPQAYGELMNFQFGFVRVLGQALAWAAGFGLFLATIGIYGIVSYAVSRRSKEMAIRQAVGARPREIVQAILRDGMRLTAWGLGLGLLVVIPVSALLRADIQGVRPVDPISVVAGAALLLVAAGAASLFPARRATRIDPVDSLRQD